MENAIEIKNLCKKFKEFELDKIDMVLPSGCIMGFIGENGAGKSTTIKLILNLIRKDSGEIKVLGCDSEHLDKTIKENIGVVLEECYFHSVFSAKTINSIMKNTYSTWNQKTFFDYMDRFNLKHDVKLKDYSRGMRMKMSIAVALSHDSHLLVLDEPTSGLDPVVRDEILDVFLDFIQDASHSILISSHIMSDLEKICDYITFIHKGKIVMSDEKDKMLDGYGILNCTDEEFAAIDKNAIVGYRKNRFSIEVLVRKDGFLFTKEPEKATIEDIMVYSVKGDR